MKSPRQLCWAALFFADTLSALPKLPTETVVGRADAEASGLSSSVITAPVSPLASNLREALAEMPGLFLQDSFGGIEPPRLSVRGSGVQSAPVSRGLRLWLDGFPLSFADGSFNTALLETAWLDHARLTPGPAAGVASLGGELSFWNRFIEAHEGGDVDASIGPDSSNALAAWQGFPLGPQRIALGFSTRRTDGWRDSARQRRETVVAFFRRPMGKDGRWEMQTHLLATNPRIDIPGPLPRAEALQNPKSVSAAVQRDRPRRETQYLRLGSRMQFASNQAFFSIGASGALHEDQFRQLLPNGSTRTSAREAALFLDFQRDWHSFREQSTNAHLSWQTSWRDTRRNRNTEGAKGARIGDNRLRPDSWTLALDHTLQARPEWRVEIGASLLHARRQIKERFDTSNTRPSTALDLSETHLAPRLALTWTPSRNFQMTLGLARSHEPPTFDDLLFTTGPMPARQLAARPLEWQQADQIEIILLGGSPQSNWRVAAYEARWEREFLRLLDTQGNPRGTVNAGETRRTGLEVYLDRSFHKVGPLTLRAWTKWQWTHFRFAGDPAFDNNRIAGVAPSSGALGLEAASADGWFLAPSVHGQSGRHFVDHANTLTAPSFAVWTLGAGRRHPSGWSVHLKVENLFDKRYISSPAGVLDRAGPAGTTAVFLPGTGRHWELGLNYAW